MICFLDLLRKNPHKATDATLDVPDILLMFVEPQVGHLGILE